MAFDDLTGLIPDLFGMLADPAIMVDSLNLILKTLQDTLNGEIFGLELPLVGDLLEDNPVSNFIEDFRVDVLQPGGLPLQVLCCLFEVIGLWLFVWNPLFD